MKLNSSPVLHQEAGFRGVNTRPRLTPTENTMTTQLQKMTVKELRNHCTELGLKTGGKKAELIIRIEEGPELENPLHGTVEPAEEAPEEPTETVEEHPRNATDGEMVAAEFELSEKGTGVYFAELEIGSSCPCCSYTMDEKTKKALVRAQEREVAKGERAVLRGERGAKIRTAREATEMSLLELANELGVSRPFLSMVERGQVGTSLQNYATIEEILNISLNL